MQAASRTNESVAAEPRNCGVFASAAAAEGLCTAHLANGSTSRRSSHSSSQAARSLGNPLPACRRFFSRLRNCCDNLLRANKAAIARLQRQWQRWTAPVSKSAWKFAHTWKFCVRRLLLNTPLTGVTRKHEAVLVRTVPGLQPKQSASIPACECQFDHRFMYLQSYVLFCPSCFYLPLFENLFNCSH